MALGGPARRRFAATLILYVFSNTYRAYGQSLQGFRGDTRSVEGGTTVDNDLITTSSTSPHPITTAILKAGHTDTPIDPEPLACRAITHLYHFNVTKNTQCSFQLPGPDGSLDLCDRCTFARLNPNCQSLYSLVDYLSFVECDCTSHRALGATLILTWMLVLMSLMGSTADIFLVPPLTLLADSLNLSPAVAGCTLLAYGNGAPDILTANAALHGADDLALLLTGLLGASLVAVTAILGHVVLVASEGDHNRLSRWHFMRDVSVYLVVVITVPIMCYHGHVALWEAILFLVFYAAYTCTIILVSHHKIRKYTKRRRYSSDLRHHRVSYLLAEAEKEEEAEEALPLTSEESVAVGARAYQSNEPIMPMPILQESSDSQRSPPNLEVNNSFRASNSLDPFEDGEADIACLSYPTDSHWLTKTRFVVELPFSILRHLSVPTNDDFWGPRRRLFSVVWPMFFGLNVIIALGGFDSLFIKIGPLEAWGVVVMVGLPFSVMLFCATQPDKPPDKIFRGALALFGFLAALAWLGIIAGEVVGVVEAFGVYLNISTGILGVTLVAIANSLGDWMADISVSRAGRSSMGIQACLASPILNDLLGLGMALSAYIIKVGHPYEIDLSDPKYNQIKVLWAFVIPTLMITLVAFPFFDYKPRKSYGIFLIIVYILFIITSVVLELNHDVEHPDSS